MQASQGFVTAAIIQSCRAMRQISVQGLCGRRPPPLIVPKSPCSLPGGKGGGGSSEGNEGYSPDFSRIHTNIYPWAPSVLTATTYQNRRHVSASEWLPA